MVSETTNQESSVMASRWSLRPACGAPMPCRHGSSIGTLPHHSPELILDCVENISNFSRRRRFSSSRPPSVVGSSLSSDTYKTKLTTKISELVIIEALDDLGSLGLGIQDCVCGCPIPWQEIKKIPRPRAPRTSHRKPRYPSVTS